MELIGNTVRKQLSENELSYIWDFKIADFNRSYRSYLLAFFKHKSISGCQLAIVPDDIQHVVKFFLFMYGCEYQSESKITFSASFLNKNDRQSKLIRSNLCHDLEETMKLFEVNSWHPLLHNCTEYILEIHLKFHKNLTPSPNVEDGVVTSEGNALAYTKCFKRPKHVTQDLKYLLISGEMSDWTFCIGEEVLNAHKLILSARSPVFKKMMEHDCLESASNSVTITDCSAPLFRTFLKYLYTGEICDNTLDTVMSLYSLGDKYDVTLLRESCSMILQSKLSSESVDDTANIVCEVLELAESHGDSKLKTLAADFVANHFPAISGKQSWKDLMKRNCELTSEILALVATGLHKQVYKTKTT